MKRALGLILLCGAAAACGSDPSAPGDAGGAGSGGKSGRAGVAGFSGSMASGGRNVGGGGEGGAAAGGRGGGAGDGAAGSRSGAGGGADVGGSNTGGGGFGGSGTSGRSNSGGNENSVGGTTDNGSGGTTDSGSGGAENSVGGTGGGVSNGGEGGVSGNGGEGDYGGEGNAVVGGSSGTSSGGVGESAGGGGAGLDGSGGIAANGGASGSGAAAGAGPVSEPCSDEGATQRCCAEGTRTCRSGSWSACEGAFISAESCNGLDDDCNGQVDELGTFSCGLGACATTVTACINGVLSACVPPQPATQIDGCNGIDDDCDGAVDEDCPTCVHVSPTGDDAAASASGGVTPFASVQAAIDFAASPASVAKRVCVAAGAACGATFTYASAADAALTMRDGVDVLGGYEATTWTRCTNSTTSLAPQVTSGVYFPSSVLSRTVLDGFTLNSHGATVDGARNVVLSHVFGPATVYVWNGQAQIAQSSVGVGAYHSEVSLIDNCPAELDSRGFCQTACVTNKPGLLGVTLDDAAGSHVEGNANCGGLDLAGDARGVVIRGNTGGAVQVGACEGAAPWFVYNSMSASNAPALVVAGDCRPVFQGASMQSSSPNLENATITTAQCSPAGGVASGCVFSNVGFSETEGLVLKASNNGTAIGLACTGGSCARIDHSVFNGLQSGVLTGGSRSATGLRLDGGRVLIDGNQFPMSNSSWGVANVGCTAIYETNAVSRIQNNIAGPYCLGKTGLFHPLSRSGGKAQIFSNYFAAAFGGIAIDVQDEVRNNVLSCSYSGGTIMSAYGLPADLHNNSITAAYGAKLGSLTINGTTVQVSTIPDLEALFAGAASGNLAAACAGSNGKLAAGSACIDAGTPSGAPEFDFEGDRRDTQPDIGADEYKP